MKILKAVLALITMFIALPISLYLQYQILKRVDASELMMFLFWVNIPVFVFVTMLSKLVEDGND